MSASRACLSLAPKSESLSIQSFRCHIDRDLCSQPTMSRLENAPSRIEVARMTAALVDIFCRSFPAPPTAITLDIDDTCDPVHGRQQMSLFNAHYDISLYIPRSPSEEGHATSRRGCD